MGRTVFREVGTQFHAYLVSLAPGFLGADGREGDEDRDPVVRAWANLSAACWPA